MELAVATYRVRTLDQAGFRDWHASIARPVNGNPVMDTKAHIQATGETVLSWRDDPPEHFMWVCPGCGGSWLGTAPVDVLECPLWHSGRCEGRWRLADGRLGPA